MFPFKRKKPTCRLKRAMSPFRSRAPVRPKSALSTLPNAATGVVAVKGAGVAAVGEAIPMAALRRSRPSPNQKPNRNHSSSLKPSHNRSSSPGQKVIG